MTGDAADRKKAGGGWLAAIAGAAILFSLIDLVHRPASMDRLLDAAAQMSGGAVTALAVF